MDVTEQSRRAKRERLADEAANAAFAKVEPLLPTSVVVKKNQNQGASSSIISSCATTTVPTARVDASEATSLMPQSSAPSS